MNFKNTDPNIIAISVEELLDLLLALGVRSANLRESNKLSWEEVDAYVYRKQHLWSKHLWFR